MGSNPATPTIGRRSFAFGANPSPVVFFAVNPPPVRLSLIVMRVAVFATAGNGWGESSDSRGVRDAFRVPMRVHLPAVVVCAVLGAVAVVLVGVSVLVQGPSPAITPPTEGIITAVTPTELSSAAGPALVSH
ncbi:hypothetical protein [Saccharopolyspora erythraea]|uniref:Uncharacterized protein n=1 Tax=Saccharopolyspora erythraea TaxID=1836 RepID=A0ABN1C1N5_SACER|nr:hypothetical protein [Saccharopolyspora erythraea]QRK91223.1 hypothetical protein JQX30_07345 [Saccharopolyspora erythraea]